MSGSLDRLRLTPSRAPEDWRSPTISERSKRREGGASPHADGSRHWPADAAALLRSQTPS